MPDETAMEIAAASPAIRCQDVTKRFLTMVRGDVWRLLRRRAPRGGAFAALDRVSLSVPAGGFVGVLGRNGAGKSTLLRIVGGVYQATEGLVTLGDRASGLYELGIGGQELMTGRQFAIRWLELNGQSAGGMAAAIEDVRDFTELGAYFDRPLRTYSAGMRARLFFAAATAVPAKVYVIDEILSVGDEYFTAKCWRRLRQRLSQGVSGLFATHDWSAVMRICGTACVLDRGRITDAGPSPEVVRRYLSHPQLDPSAARFGATLQDRLEARAEDSAAWRFPVEIDVEGEVMFSMSVEQFRPFFGWEHLLHVEPTGIGDGPGRYEVEVAIPELPLRAGSYCVNLFLARRSGSVDSGFDVFDARSWLRGDGLALEVAGPGGEAHTHVPMAWTMDAGA